MSTEALDTLARMLKRADRGAAIAENWSNNLQPTYGTIEDTEDPEKRGRVKIALDETNPEILDEQGLPQKSRNPTLTDWIEPQVPFSGLQPPALKKKRVPVIPRAGDPNRLFFGDPVFDPKEFKEAEQPGNSAMTRLPVYCSGKLPPASKENIGCMVIEEQGPMKCDWLCVCLKREDGEYYWVRHIDINHIHAGQDDGRQPPDCRGDGEAPVAEGPSWDLTKPTTAKQYEQQSYNPEDAGWFGGAESEEDSQQGGLTDALGGGGGGLTDASSEECTYQEDTTEEVIDKGVDEEGGAGTDSSQSSSCGGGLDSLLQLSAEAELLGGLPLDGLPTVPGFPGLPSIPSGGLPGLGNISAQAAKIIQSQATRFFKIPGLPF